MSSIIMLYSFLFLKLRCVERIESINNDLDNVNKSENNSFIQLDNNDAESKCKGFEYIGIGYDSIVTKLTTEDEPITDLGYRYPILNLQQYGSTTSSHASTGCVYPLDTYYRPYLSCQRKESISKIGSTLGYENAFGIEAKTNFKNKSVEFAANAQYEQSSKNIEQNKYREIINIINCFQAEMGLPINLKWKIRSDFSKAVLELREAFGIKENDKSPICSPENYNKPGKHCREVRRWINLIKSYGTHYIHKIRIGGKLVQSVKISESNIESMEKRGIDAQVEIQAEMINITGSITDKPSKTTDEIEKNAIKKVRVIGGVMPKLPLSPKTFKMWTKTLDSDPMPIYMEIDPLYKIIEQVLENDEGFNIKREYNMALKFYAELKGATYKQIMGISGYIPSISHLIRNSTIVTINSHNKSILRCKKGSRIVAGLSIFFNNDGIATHLFPCKSSMNECSVPDVDGDVAYTWAWALCSNHIIPNIEQVVTKDFKKGILQCPEGYKMGFGLTFKEKMAYYINGYINVIPLDNPNIEVMDGSSGWIVCFEQDMVYDNYSTIVRIDHSNKKVVAECQNNSVVIGGVKISMALPSDEDKLAKVEECDKFVTSCTAGPKAGFVWIICGDK